MQPLAERMRPTALSDFIGQQHLIGEGKVLDLFLKNRYLPSMIFWGPPGVGKTTLAFLIAKELQRPISVLSAVHSGVKEVREAIHHARSRDIFDGGAPIVFIDEIHRFNKSQQDALLAAVEQGSIVLLGATTENPSFEVNAALLSRCQVYVLNPLTDVELKELISRIIKQDILFKDREIEMAEFDKIIQFANGDGRKLCNIMEIIGNDPDSPTAITNAYVESKVQQNILQFDKAGDLHYDMASALIKSIRGSDPNAALYWLARLIECGENVRFIARRLCISASEDIGLANPNALLMAVACKDAVDFVGFPESRIILAQCVIYLAGSAKSNSAYLAIEKALDIVRSTGDQPVPLHLRNAVTGLMRSLNYGQGYAYVHDFEDNFKVQEYMPEKLANSKIYEPADNPAEKKLEQQLALWWEAKYNYKRN